MRYTINHRWGDSADAESIGGQVLAALLAELDGPTDVEHPDVWITDNDSGWCLSVFAGDSGLVVLENDEAGIILHRRGLGSAEVTALCMTFGAGNLESVLRRAGCPVTGDRRLLDSIPCADRPTRA